MAIFADEPLLGPGGPGLVSRVESVVIGGSRGRLAMLTKAVLLLTKPMLQEQSLAKTRWEGEGSSVREREAR